MPGTRVIDFGDDGEGRYWNDGREGQGGGGAAWLAKSERDADQTEYARVLDAISEGPILGLVDGLKSVYLDDTPIQNGDGSFNFSGLHMQLVAGTGTQSDLDGFPGTENEVAVGVKVSVLGGAISRTISTQGLDAIRVNISNPVFKAIHHETGKEEGTVARVKIEGSSPNYNGAAWYTFPLSGDGEMFGLFNSKRSVGYRLDLPGDGPWTIKVTRLTADGDSYNLNETWWDSYDEIQDVKLSYPYTAVAGLMFNPARFRSIPRRGYEIYGRIVKIPSNYNASTRVYTGVWNGTFVDGWTDNPAWIWYDLATNTRYGAGSYLDASQIDKWSLYTIAQYCDAMVDDGLGGTEPRFRCNLYLTSREEAIKVLQQVASVFRGMAYWASGLVVPVQDAPASATALFSQSNVLGGRFTYSGTARKARHTATLVAWNDPTDNYKQQIELVEDQAAIARYGYQPAELTSFGCTSRGQARRAGLWLLATEQTETETINFTAGLEGTGVGVGTLIQVKDPFRAGNIRAAGRIIASTSTSITVDAPFTTEAGKGYRLYYTLPNGGLGSGVITNSPGTISTFTLPTIPMLPGADAQWQLLEVTTETPALYRVVSISEVDGWNYEMTAVLHNPDKFDAVEAGLTLGPTTARAGISFPAVTGMTVSDSTRIQTDKLTQVLSAGWTPATGATSYQAAMSRDNGPWEDMTCSGPSAVAEVTPGAYRVRVAAVYPAGVSKWTEASRTVAVPSVLPTALADMTSDAKITDSEKVQLRRWLEDQRQKWVSAYDAAVAAGMSTSADPLAGRRDSLWKAAYGYFAGILYTTTGSFDSYGCVGLGAARTGTADIYPTRPVGENDPYKIDNGAWLTMLTGLQNAPLAVRSDIAALPATASVKGLVRPGTGLTVAPDGTLNLSGGGTASWAGLAGTPTDSTPLMTLFAGKVGTGDSRLSDARPASDVYSWAKAATKPSYTYSEVGAAPSSTVSFPGFGTTAGTACQGNDSRLSDFRPASDVYAWAKASTKPAYTAAEVGALGATAQAADSAKLGGQLPSYYQTALGFTPVNKAGDSGIGNLSMGALTATGTATGLSGWKMSGKFQATDYPMLEWAATGSDKFARIGNNADGSLWFYLGGSSSSLGVNGLTLNANGSATFSGTVNAGIIAGTFGSNKDLYLAPGAGTGKVYIANSGYGPILTVDSTTGNTILAGALAATQIEVTAGTFGAGRLYRSGVYGTTLAGYTGSSWDLSLVAANGNPVMTVPTGTSNATFSSALYGQGGLEVYKSSYYPARFYNVGAVSCYIYSDAGGAGIANANPFSSGALFYLSGQNACLYGGGTERIVLDGSNGDVVVDGTFRRPAPGVGYLNGWYNEGGETGATTGPIYCINATNYAPSSTALGNMYGIGYTYSGGVTSVRPTGCTVNEWGLYVTDGGVSRAFISGSSGTLWTNGEHYAMGGKLVYHAGNIDTAPASLQALKSLAGSPLVGTYTEMQALAPASYNGQYFYVTDLYDSTSPNPLDQTTDRNGQGAGYDKGVLYKSNGTAWSYYSAPAIVTARIKGGTASFGSIGARALAADMALANCFRTTTVTWTGTPLALGSYLDKGAIIIGEGGSTGGQSATSTTAGIYVGDEGIQVKRARIREANFIINRITNGLFYSNLSPWTTGSTGAAFAIAYSSTSRTTATGSARATGYVDIADGQTLSLSGAAAISQLVKVPAKIVGVSPVLKLAYLATTDSPDVRLYNTAISIYVQNVETGAAEQVAATTGAITADGAWHQVSLTLDATKLWPNGTSDPGADFILKAQVNFTEQHRNQTGSPIRVTSTVYVDELNLTI